jgi:hypothetical protein
LGKPARGPPSRLFIFYDKRRQPASNSYAAIGMFEVTREASGWADSMQHERLCSACLIAAAALAATIAIGGFLPAQAENSAISTRRATERTSFSNDEIKDGLFKTAFRAELQLDRRDERIRKFDEPVRVFVDNHGAPARTADIAAIVDDIRARVHDLDLAVTSDRKDANVVVMLVPRRDFARTIRSRYGESAAKKIQNSLHPECLSGIAKDERYRIRRAEVILPVDAEEFQFYDCAYEELLQSLGLINDDSSVPWTMFNDNVQMGFFDVYDQYLVNILYDPRIRPGMTKGEVDALLPDVFPTVRAWVAKANSAKGESARDGLNVDEHNGAARTAAAAVTLERTESQQRR